MQRPFYLIFSIDDTDALYHMIIANNIPYSFGTSQETVEISTFPVPRIKSNHRIPAFQALCGLHIHGNTLFLINPDMRQMPVFRLICRMIPVYTFLFGFIIRSQPRQRLRQRILHSC